jgi:hypothetical protein
MMTLEKQVEIPTNRHIHLDVDFTLPEAWVPGEVISLVIRPLPQSAAADVSPIGMSFPSFRDIGEDEEKAKFRAARQKLQELCKDSKLTVESFLAMKPADRVLEAAIERRLATEGNSL